MMQREPRPAVRAILTDGDPWHAFGRWGQATVQYHADSVGRNRFHGLTPLAWRLIRLACWWSDWWLNVYAWWDELEQRAQAKATAHQRRMASLRRTGR